MDKNITVIAGDGIGPEVTYETLKVLTAVALKFKHNFNFSHRLMGALLLKKRAIRCPMKPLKAA